MEGGGGGLIYCTQMDNSSTKYSFWSPPPSAFAPSHTATLNPPVGKRVSTRVSTIYFLSGEGGVWGGAGEPGGGAGGA